MRRALLLSLACAAMLVLAPSASAAETRCTGLLSGPHENVRVPQGADCNLVNAQVQNSVKVDKEASIRTMNVQIGNAFQLTEPRNSAGQPISIVTTQVGGNLEIKEYRTRFPSAPNRICGSEIEGNLQISDSNRLTPPGVGWAIGTVDQCGAPLGGNDIGGNVLVTNNRGLPFSVRIGQNNIEGNLDCRDNEPPATNEGNNVGGHQSGECG